MRAGTGVAIHALKAAFPLLISWLYSAEGSTRPSIMGRSGPGIGICSGYSAFMDDGWRRG